MKFFGVLAVIMIALFVHSAESHPSVEVDAENSFNSAVEEIDEIDEEPECICTMEYNPICGSDAVTYSNPCMFRCEADSPRGKRANLFIAFYGEC